jgi:sugar phosphate isomerase/epimerase
MRLGGPVYTGIDDLEEWVRQHAASGYRAAYCPALDVNDTARIAAVREAAARADIVIAEVGAWSNPISVNKKERDEAIAYCQKQLTLADEVGARCCVNIAGSRGAKWDGPHADNYTQETFELIVDTVRTIIDAVKPIRTFYTLETMPWIFPDSADSYLDLVEAIDRDAFAVHFDPVNIITSPRSYFDNANLIKQFIKELGPYIKSCHAKDIRLENHLTVELHETRQGLGLLDYSVFLQELSKLEPNTPLMLEHLPSEEDYRLAAQHIRGIASNIGVSLL